MAGNDSAPHKTSIFNLSPPSLCTYILHNTYLPIAGFRNLRKYHTYTQTPPPTLEVPYLPIEAVQPPPESPPSPVMSGVKDNDDDDDDDATQPSAVAVVDDDDGGGGSGGGARDDRRRDDQHAVRVKPEYVLPEEEDRPPPPPTPTTDGGNGEGGGRDDDRRNDNDGDGDDGGKKKNRGMNKKRPRDVKIDYGEKACLSVVRGQPCPFLTMAGGCKYNHDLRGMLSNRPADRHEGEGGAVWLEGKCPFWISRG